MNKTTYNLKVTFTTPILGSQPDKKVATEYLLSKLDEPALADEESETLTPEGALEKGTTVFHKSAAGDCLLWDYQLKGFLKASAGFHNGTHNVKGLKMKFNNGVFVFDSYGVGRHFMLHAPDGYQMEYNERPLRAETAQGPRNALARSEQLPAGTWFECKIVVLGTQITEDILREVLDYGAFQGLGQWRNGGNGRFTYTLTKE